MVSMKPFLNRRSVLCLAAGLLLLNSLYGVEVTAQSVPSAGETATILTGPPPPPPSSPNIPTKDLEVGGETVTISPLPTDSSNPPANITVSPSPYTHTFPLDNHKPPVTDGFSINVTIPIGSKE
jgi:hypothetical protein